MDWLWPVIILLALLCLGNLTFNMMFNPRSFRPNINKKGKKEGSEMSDGFPKLWLDDRERKDIYLRDDDSPCLHALLMRGSSHKWAIILHGYTSDCEHYAAYGKHYLEQGFNVLLPDARAHGKSGGQFIGMGYPERLDLIKWCNYILEQDSTAGIILHGMSMGGATVLLASGEATLPKQVRAIIADSAYPSTREMLQNQLSLFFHLPAFPLLYLADIISRLKCGYSITGHGIAAEAAARSATPTLFIHGRKDNFVPLAQHERLYAAAQCPKERLLLDEGHIMGRFKQEQLYWQHIDNFISRQL